MSEYRFTEDGVEVPHREVRQMARVELRAEDGVPRLDGYATVYDYAYDVAGGPELGGFTEVIASGAAAKSAGEADVRLLVNHDGVPLARTRSKTLMLESDDVGLRVRAELDPANPVVQELRSAMDRGDIDEMSFAFRAIRSEWSPDYTMRTITEVRLFDVSLVTYPANPATVAKMRDAQIEAEQRAGRSLALARRQYEALTH